MTFASEEFSSNYRKTGRVKISTSNGWVYSSSIDITGHTWNYSNLHDPHWFVQCMTMKM